MAVPYSLSSFHPFYKNKQTSFSPIECVSPLHPYSSLLLACKGNRSESLALWLLLGWTNEKAPQETRGQERSEVLFVFSGSLPIRSPWISLIHWKKFLPVLKQPEVLIFGLFLSLLDSLRKSPTGMEKLTLATVNLPWRQKKCVFPSQNRGILSLLPI